MAVSVRIEDEAFSDRRYDVLARMLGLPDADCARGKMAAVWRQCTQQQTHILSAEMVREILGDNGADALIKSTLGEAIEGGIRIRGTRGRIEWLAKLRKNARKGGTARAAKRLPNRQPIGTSADHPDTSPPAPAPAPAPTDQKEGSADATPVVKSGRKNPERIPERAWKAADYLRDLILADDPKAVVGRKDWDANTKTGLRLEWADVIRLMVERENRTYEEIAAVLKFVFQEQSGDAKFIVQSASALRDKFDRIQAVRRNTPQSKATSKPASIPIAQGSLRIVNGGGS